MRATAFPKLNRAVVFVIGSLAAANGGRADEFLCNNDPNCEAEARVRANPPPGQGALFINGMDRLCLPGQVCCYGYSPHKVCGPLANIRRAATIACLTSKTVIQPAPEILNRCSILTNAARSIEAVQKISVQRVQETKQAQQQLRDLRAGAAIGPTKAQDQWAEPGPDKPQQSAEMKYWLVFKACFPAGCLPALVGPYADQMQCIRGSAAALQLPQFSGAGFDMTGNAGCRPLALDRPFGAYTVSSAAPTPSAGVAPSPGVVKSGK
jgi:hypothetical protein